MKAFIATNLFVFVIGAIMLFIAIYNIRNHRRTSVCLIVIVGLVAFLAVSESLQDYFKGISNIIGATICAFLGYVLRPLCIVVFILLCQGEPKGKWIFLFFAPAILNFLVFSLAFIPGARDLLFFFSPTEDLAGIAFHGGPLRFASHGISALYLAYFVYVSFTRMKMKHIENAVIILICVALIVFCVIFETFDANGDIHLLNTGIMVSVIFYYLFLYIESVRYDPLTGLFNRATYYQDILKMEKSATGVIQFDMNGLKYLNDNFGHQEGDKAIKDVAKIIVDSCNRKMYAYRLGGDEFIVIANSVVEEDIKTLIKKVEEGLVKVNRSCSIGYAYRDDKSISLDALMKEAEKRMYLAKDEYYKTAKIERREGLK